MEGRIEGEEVKVSPALKEVAGWIGIWFSSILAREKCRYFDIEKEILLFLGNQNTQMCYSSRGHCSKGERISFYVSSLLNCSFR